MAEEALSHWLVVVLFGPAPADLWSFLLEVQASGIQLALVDNTPEPQPPWPNQSGGCWLHQANRGGLAGGFNAGVRAAIAAGAAWITLLDQDSRIDPKRLPVLCQAWQRWPQQRLLVGPQIINQADGQRHGRSQPRDLDYDSTRLLISSGTTFRSCDWPQLGAFKETLFIDFLDHAWCFRAQSLGFQLLQDRRVVLRQVFGAPHPNRFCRRLGMQLYSPTRHYYGLRNLRWLVRQPEVPRDLKIKEVAKMLLKPWLWLLLEPQRRANARAIIRALLDPLPQ
jgi:rhamnosyltransferase